MLAKRIGIDLGTSTLLVYVRGEGVVVNEPSPAASSAPVQGAEDMLRSAIERVQGRQRLFKPEVVICVPSGTAGGERRALTEAAIAAGARQAWLIDEPLAAAIGAGLPIDEGGGIAVCDVGGGSTKIAVIARSGILVAHSVPAGGTSLDEAIAAFLKRCHHLLVEAWEAEAIKLSVGAAAPAPEARSTGVGGRDARSGLRREVTVSSGEIMDAIEEPLAAIAEAVRAVLDQAPHELAAGIRRRGVVLTGGGALLPGIDRCLESRTGVRTAVAGNPQTCAVRGAGLGLDQLQVLRRSQGPLR